MVPVICSMTDRIFCHFGPFFAFLPPEKPKYQNFENLKKCLEISLFDTSVPKIMIICYTVPEIWCMTDVVIIFHFGLLSALLPAYQPKKSKFKKNDNNACRYYHFTHVHQKL